MTRNLLVMDDWYGIRAKAVVDDPVNNRIIKVTKQTKLWYIIFYLVIWNFVDFTSELCLCRRKWCVYFFAEWWVLFIELLRWLSSLTKKKSSPNFCFLISWLELMIDLVGLARNINYTATGWMHDVISVIFEE